MTQANTTKTRNAAIQTTVDGTGLVLTFSNGKRLSLHLSQLSSVISEAATMHGLKQKLVDAAAISRNTETGRPATIEDKYAAVKEVYDRIVSLDGTWNAIREGGTGNTGGQLLRALCELQPAKPAEEIKTWLATKTDAEKAALRKNAKVAAIIARLQAESADPDIDTDAMLDEMGE